LSAGQEITILNHKNLSPPDGGTLRIKSFVDGLASRGHNVSFAYWGSADPDSMAGRTITMKNPAPWLFQRLGEKLYGGAEGRAAVELLFCNYPTMFMKLHRSLKSSSIFQAEQIWSAEIPLLYRKVMNKVSVLDNHNVEALLAQRLYPYVKKKSAYRYWMSYVSMLEKSCCGMADQVIVTSEIDKLNLERFHKVSSKKISVIPNGTDVNRYRPNETLRNETRKELRIQEAAPVLCYVGRGSYPPNKIAIEYIRDTLAPAVWEKCPNARFLMVSRDLPQDCFGSDGRFINVVEGSDYPYINASDVCLAPLAVGGGTRIKIANYLACGKPVVSTAIGCEGIPARLGSEIVISDFESFPDKVLELIEEPKTREELGRNARSFAVRNCSWEKSILELDKLYSGLWSKNGN
jgi:glycosyltransferase involved in cell wall biosynthesis